MMFLTALTVDSVVIGLVWKFLVFDPCLVTKWLAAAPCRFATISILIILLLVLAVPGLLPLKDACADCTPECVTEAT